MEQRERGKVGGTAYRGKGNHQANRRAKEEHETHKPNGFHMGKPSLYVHTTYTPAEPIKHCSGFQAFQVFPF